MTPQDVLVAIESLPWAELEPVALALLKRFEPAITNPFGRLAVDELIHLLTPKAPASVQPDQTIAPNPTGIQQ